MRWLSMLALFALLAGCDGEDPMGTEDFIRTTLVINETTTVEIDDSTIVVDEGDYWGCQTTMATGEHGVGMVFMPDLVTGPGDYALDGTAGVTVAMIENPEGDGAFRVATSTSGTIHLVDLDREAGVATGTFEGVVMVDMSTTEPPFMATAESGEFDCF